MNASPPASHASLNGKAIWCVIAVFAVALVAFIAYKAMIRTAPEPVPEKSAPVPKSSMNADEPAIRYPVTQQLEEKPLPALDVSDATMRNALAELLHEKTLIEVFELQQFVRRVVATIDNLPRTKVATTLLPVKPAAGQFIVTGKDHLSVGTNNAARYERYAKVVDAVDTQKLIAVYVHFYPLFQQAYKELGYPNGYFNDRLIEVIDHLLATPEVPEPLNLVQPKVQYLFADPTLESRSAGQKLLLRVGHENAALIKAKLREIRSEILRHVPQRH